jgi:glycerophosphoryl diester phosphodiesterase
VCAYLLGFRFAENELVIVNNGDPIVFAHRGIKNYFAENSAESFSGAEELKFKALEIDISLTKDNVPILFHDDDGKRLLGIDANINDLGYDLIKDEFLHFEGIKTANQIMTLRQFINDEQKDNIVYVDVKEPSRILADSLLYYIASSGKYKSTLVADANILFLSYLKYRDPEILTILEGFNKGKEWIYFMIPHKFRPNFYASFLAQVDDGHIDFLKKHNMIDRKIVYGVNSENLQTVIDFGIQNVIIDYDSSMINAEYIVSMLSIGSNQ